MRPARLFYRNFLALVPPPWPRRRIGKVRAGIEFLGPEVSDDRLHLSLALLSETEAPDAALAERLDAAFAGDSLGACTVMLERLVLNGTAALEPVGRDCPVPRLQEGIAKALAAAGVPPLHRTKQPHVTLGYTPRGSGRRPIAPIGWRADRIAWIESHVGKHRHRLRGSWPLMPVPPAPTQLGFDF